MIKTGDIFAIKGNETDGINLLRKTRPGIVIQILEDEQYRVVPITSNVRAEKKNSIILRIPGMKQSRHVCANLDKSFIVGKEAIANKIGECSQSTLYNIQKAMKMQREPEVIGEDGDVDEKKTEPENEIEMMIRNVMAEYFPEKNAIIMYPEGMDMLMENAKEARDTLDEMNSPKAKRSNIIVAIWTGIIASLITNLIWLFLPSEDIRVTVVNFFNTLFSGGN